ncbi:maltokinase N-terminal cap-like domain-containing protein [Cryptosporangium phraense]|uniref:Maltokinase n=1 Tax=Cryptosporangium phraense TaxID=2593070 RepID=A0A545ASF7_9ACTN|nr:aminoglycoside phosphotransferase [Cryptosporangium phraense]TQS44181.1 aminoglycoside phosphotransferase [Cryptosporangium phraense]
MTALVTHAEALTGLLSSWLPKQRWFGDKQSHIDDVSVVKADTWFDDLPSGGPRLDHVVVGVASGGRVERYQLLVGLRRGELPERLDHARIGPVEDLVAYDAAHDLDLTGEIRDLIAANKDVGGVRFRHEPGAVIDTDLASRPISAEQSNTSVVFGGEYIMKLFRKLDRGVSPDLELHRALRSVGSEHIAELYGAIEGELQDAPVTYGLLQKFFANTADGWAMATASVRDLINEPETPIAELGSDFSTEACRLGQAVAAVHRDLVTALGTEVVPVDRLDSVVAGMNARLDAVLRRVSGLAPFEPGIRRVFAEVADHGEPVIVQRIHGDLHLGQVLRTLQGWVLIDFEGEPARPLPERVAKMSPLRDVAGMLRSFDYAAHHLLVGHVEAEEIDPSVDERVVEWADRNRAAFIEGYAKDGITLADPEANPALLRALELDKAVYEVAYEYDNRPSWVDIPLRSIARLATT